MDAAQALRELMEVSSQITAAVVLDADGAVLASAPEDPGGAAAPTALAASTQELVTAASSLGGADGRDVTRVEVELGEGAFFVVREGGRTVGATTGPNPTSGLVIYDLRTCVQAVQDEPKKRRSTRKPKAEAE